MSDTKNVLVVGAGFTGAVVARKLAEAGHKVKVIDERDHVAGNCHTERHEETGVMLHVYGPHIFHTDNQQVWDFLTEHCKMMPYRHQVRANVAGKVYSMPINLHTMNQFFSACMSPKEARAFVQELAETDIEDPVSFEEQALKFVGRDIYEAFFRGYTLKQWAVDPKRLPASILKRLPLRFTYDDNYFSHKYQGIPFEGYTCAVQSILDHPQIEVALSTPAESCWDDENSYDHVVYTGPLDRYFDHQIGRLTYRTLRFEVEVKDAPYQGTAVLNYCDPDVPYTRITEHMYFAPWEAEGFEKSVIYREYSAEAGPDDIPDYPVRLLDDQTMLASYVSLANAAPRVTFAGRLGTYAYLDMDVAIARAFDVADHINSAFARGQTPAAFVHKV
jgi:UDP-galactopyranose mutase